MPVTLNVPITGGNITVTNDAGTQSLSFTGQAGGPASPAQKLQVWTATTPPGINFSYATNASWLLVNAAQTGQAITPATLSVSVNPGALAAGRHDGSITFTPVGGQTVTISVSLTITPSYSVSASPASLSASYIGGGPSPQSQVIQVSGNGGALPFTATASSAGNWLAVSPTSGTTSADGAIPLTVSFANLSSLAANQTYNGTIVVAGTGGAAGSTTIPVTLSISAPLATIAKVTNAASFVSGGISAGEIITIFGTALGPEAGVAVTQDLIVNGRMPTALGGVQVLVGDERWTICASGLLRRGARTCCRDHASERRNPRRRTFRRFAAGSHSRRRRLAVEG